MPCALEDVAHSGAVIACLSDGTDCVLSLEWDLRPGLDTALGTPLRRDKGALCPTQLP